MTAGSTGSAIRGIAAAVPRGVVGPADVREELKAIAQKIAATTGVRSRRVGPEALTASDLSFAAALRLLEELEWDPACVDGLVFMSQTPDYLLPATACVLHGKLSLRTDSLAFDVNLGCSAYPYGLSIVDSMIRAGVGRRWLLLVGDTIHRLTNPDDQSVAHLFGDAGSATALEATGGATEAGLFAFQFGTDGSGWHHLQVAAGGLRHRLPARAGAASFPSSPELPHPECLYMDGGEIFNFALQRVPALVRRVLEASAWTAEEVDYFVFHQANGFLLEHLGRKLRIPREKMPLTIGEFGNTSGVSLPLTIAQCVAREARVKSLKVVAVGFGVGYSWAGCAMRLSEFSCPPIVEV